MTMVLTMSHQNEAQPAQGPLDEGLPEICRQGDDRRAYSYPTHHRGSYSPLSSRQDSTIEFEKRRNVPVRYDRELVKTTVEAMKRVAEIKQRREHAFWKNRCALTIYPSPSSTHIALRMLASREKLRTHRKKKLEAKASVKLVEPMQVEAAEPEAIREKIKVSAKSRSALVPGEGRSMGMDID